MQQNTNKPQRPTNFLDLPIANIRTKISELQQKLDEEDPDYVAQKEDMINVINEGKQIINLFEELIDHCQQMNQSIGKDFDTVFKMIGDNFDQANIVFDRYLKWYESMRKVRSEVYRSTAS